MGASRPSAGMLNPERLLNKAANCPAPWAEVRRRKDPSGAGTRVLFRGSQQRVIWNRLAFQGLFRSPARSAHPPGGRNLRRRGTPRRRRGTWASFRSSSARKRSAAASDPGTGPDPEPPSPVRVAQGGGADGAEVGGGSCGGETFGGETPGMQTFTGKAVGDVVSAAGWVTGRWVAAGAGRPGLGGLDTGRGSGEGGAGLALSPGAAAIAPSCRRSCSNRSTPCWISTLAMLLTVRDSSSASRARRWHSSSGITT
jgi:hypothetical protein